MMPRFVILLGFALIVPVTVLAQANSEQLAQAQELLDGGDPSAALEILDRLVKRKPPSAQAYLLRSTALFMVGDLDKGRRDLDRSLEIDPRLRQAWLNRAALDLANQSYPEALEALETAKALDPAAPGTDQHRTRSAGQQGCHRRAR